MKILAKLIISSLLLIILPFQLAHLFFENRIYTGQVAGLLKSRQETVKVTALVGKYRFTLFGFSSPQATITLNGQGIYDQTIANDQGYFIFKNRFSPLSPRETCLNAKDQLGRFSSPVCLPPFPIQYNTEIGPIIISPTVSLNHPSAGGDFFLGDQVILSGQTIPNSEINLAIFNENGGNISFLNFPLIKPVEAFTFPKITSMSDNKGNFSINLPSSHPEKYRLFAQVNYIKSISPNSVKLNLEILPVWMIIVKFFLFLFFLIRPRLLEVTIVLEILYILHVLMDHFRKKAIILYQSRLPAMEEKRPLVKY